jgi:hypothetical protein
MRYPRPRVLAALTLLCSALLGASRLAAAPAGPPPGSPGAAAAWRQLAWRDENGVIPPGALARAAAQRERLIGPRALLPGDQWVERGPNDVAGRTRCLVIHPTLPLVMWMGTAGGGVWKSVDGGASWAPKSDRLASLAVSALALDPADPDVLYMGTGEGYFNEDSLRGVGIYRSGDGGTSWELLPGTAALGPINKITVSPADSNLLLATSTSFTTGGVWRSTDRGATWTRVIPAAAGYSALFLPSDPSVAVASIVALDDTDGWACTALWSADSGATWTPATGPLAALDGFRVELAASRSSGSMVYASTDQGEVYRSGNKGASYSRVGRGTSTNADSNHIWVDPTNAKTVVVSGRYLSRSTDSGATWTRISSGGIQTDQPHPGVHFLIEAPGYDGSVNKKLYACTDGGVFQTLDVTAVSTSAGWARLDRGARTSQFYSAAGDGATGTIIGGTRSNGTLRLAGGTDSATVDAGGDGGFVAIDPTDPSVSYNEPGYLKICRNTGGAGSGASTPIWANLPDAVDYNANFIAPFLLDPSDPKVLVAGGASLWRCADIRAESPTFTQIRGPGFDFISAIAISPANSDIIFVGQNDGELFVTFNGTEESPEWIELDNNLFDNPLPNRYITRILADPDDVGTAYVCLGGFTRNNVWVTRDAGFTWESCSGIGASALPEAPVRAIARNPDDPQVLHVGTEVGVFSSADGGVTWSTTNDAPANVSVDDLSYMSGTTTLLAATHGRGIWQLHAGGALASLVLSKTTITGGLPLTGTVTLRSRAPEGGLTVALQNTNPFADVPTSVSIPAGTASATFTILTTPVAAKKTGRITATLAGSRATADLAVVPPDLTGLAVAPEQVSAASSATGSVFLPTPAPAGGTKITLTSGAPAVASVPASVTIPEGAVSAEFPVTTKAVAVVTTVQISGTLGGKTFSASLTVVPVALKSLTLTPRSSFGGVLSTRPVATVTLATAPLTDVAIPVSSSAPAAAPGFTVTVPGGATTGTALVETLPVDATILVVLTATHGTKAAKANLSVKTAGLRSFLRSVPSLIGGSTTPLSAKVTLTSAAGPSGKVVTLKSDNPAVTIPASVKLEPGTASIRFDLQHSAVDTAVTVRLTATLGAATKTCSVLVKPFPGKITVSPTRITGGAGARGQITLPAAATRRLTFGLSSSDPHVSVPAAVTVLAGQTRVTFSLTSSPVAGETAVAITASYGNATRSAPLTLVPPVLSSLTLSTASVQGGSTTRVRLKVGLNYPAPEGGMEIAFSSSAPDAAAVPETAFIPEGARSATLYVTHKAVSANTKVIFTARLRGAEKTAALTVTP